MRGMRELGVVTAWLLGAQPGVVPALAQEPVPQKCSAVLAAPTRDSVRLRVGLQIHANRDDDLPASFRQDLGEAIRERLVLPTPLGMDAYETTEDSAHVVRASHLATWGSYRAIITRDGRIADAEVTGGTRNAAFDAALIAATKFVDSAAVRSAMVAAGISNEDVPIRVEVSTRTADDVGTTPVLGRVMITGIRSGQTPGQPTIPVVRPDSEVLVPLFAYRAPLRAVTQAGRRIPGRGMLRYPDSLLRARASGEVLLTYVVGDEGVPEAGSALVRSATYRQFAQSVLSALPNFRFQRLMVEGCAVRQVVTQPFNFFISQ